MEKADHTGQPEENKAAGDYEKLNALLYAYRFGTIGFLELLDAFEKVLHIELRRSSASMTLTDYSKLIGVIGIEHVVVTVMVGVTG